MIAACGGSIGDPGGGDGGVEADARPPCTTPTDERRGNGEDDDCDGLIDEAKVCATGGDFATIGEAVAAAPDGTGIELCAGTFAERFEIAGKAIAFRGAGADATIIDGQAAGTVVSIRAGAAAKLEALTIRNGRTTGGGGNIVCDGGGVGLVAAAVAGGRAEEGGGGLYARACSVLVETTRFTGNEGRAMGGGALLIDSTGEIRDSHFSANAADDGGGLYVYEGSMAVRATELRGNHGRVHGGAIHLAADATLEHNMLGANQSGWTGGGIYVDRHAPVIRGNTIDGNTAVEEGGGIYLHESQAVVTENRITNNEAQDDGGGLRLFTCNARVERNVITGNRSGADGGGFKSSHLPTQFIDNEITDNVAAWSGGGMELDNDSSVVRGGLVARNRASRGGGIHVMLWPWNNGVIEDVRIVENRAGKGGGVHLENNFVHVLLRRVTIENNTAGEDGAGLYARTTNFTLTNATVVGNDANRDGGAIWVGRPQFPWADECPCPPAEPTMKISFSVLHGNSAPTGAAVWTSLSGVTVESSIVDANEGIGVAAMEGAQPRWLYNDTQPASFQGMANPTGANGNLAVTPAFMDVAARDFRLQGASACIDAGNPQMRDRDGSRADMGAFAGPEAP